MSCRKKDGRAAGRVTAQVAGRSAMRIMELSLPGAKVPFVLWNFCSLELSLPGAKVPRTFVPWNFRSRERKSLTGLADEFCRLVGLLVTDKVIFHFQLLLYIYSYS